jgi:GntR family transcriptional regulator
MLPKANPSRKNSPEAPGENYRIFANSEQTALTEHRLLYYSRNALMQVTPLQFEVHPSSGVPIYRQIMDQVRALVAGGKLAPGDTLPSVRQMGAELGINMMTVSKAYSKLEAEGVVSRSRGQGMVVDRVDVGGTVADRRKELQPFAEQLVVRGIQLSLSDEQMLSVVKSSQRDLRETASA